MSGTPKPLAALLAECDRLGVRLTPTDDGGLEVDGPRNALTPDVLDRLRTHKAALLAIVRATPVVPADPSTAVPMAAERPTIPVCRCGAEAYRDVPIHNGRSTRRDCERCGRFIAFPVWHGKDAFRNEQH